MSLQRQVFVSSFTGGSTSDKSQGLVGQAERTKEGMRICIERTITIEICFRPSRIVRKIKGERLYEYFYPEV